MNTEINKYGPEEEPTVNLEEIRKNITELQHQEKKLLEKLEKNGKTITINADDDYVMNSDKLDATKFGFDVTKADRQIIEKNGFVIDRDWIESEPSEKTEDGWTYSSDRFIRFIKK